MPFTYSIEATRNLATTERCIQDIRNAPVRNRSTQFQLAQQNMLAYTFGEVIPGFASAGINGMDYRDVIGRPVENAVTEGTHFFRDDFRVDSNAKAKVAGDIFEIVSSAVMWNCAARWNSLMVGEGWRSQPRYSRPTLSPSPRRQVAVLNLPRSFDWVSLLVPESQEVIEEFRAGLRKDGLGLPTSTPDLAVVVLPEEFQNDEMWREEIAGLTRPNQILLSGAYQRLQGRVQPGEISLAVAFKRSLRSDRLYQPLYEANVMQLLLEGKLGAPKVEFEVHTLAPEGTNAFVTYEAASLYGLAEGRSAVHRAIRELYVPPTAADLARRFFAFLNERMELVNG
ncbi:Cfr10I/Bse634I family restriction endonuclease [Streptomyces cyaneofuscatus]|nr:Cfr10I/Bse634I family restriction endonuclease [Streptomyces cyaneofuscatus]WRO11056.1 Cfr10I/Bse634I family restriction endonuclease [Streptomyces cyaneofuscatus]6OBJ_A Chain A, SgraIR restriction enzyme [Streptomyces griseus]6OBJ_B Chain B, SgraIR restriction enzyme [Streptomyces griseus]